jgi:hypothetical protein
VPVKFSNQDLEPGVAALRARTIEELEDWEIEVISKAKVPREYAFIGQMLTKAKN